MIGRISAALVLAIVLAPDVTSMAQSTGQHDQLELRSVRTGLLYSVLGTAVPILGGALMTTGGATADMPGISGLLIASGAIIGPSLGHFYAKNSTYALTMTGIRAGLVVGFGGLAIAQCPEFEGCTDEEETRMVIFGLTGIVLVSASAILDFTRIPIAVGEYNALASSLGLVPLAGFDGRLRPGISLVVRTGT